MNNLFALHSHSMFALTLVQFDWACRVWSRVVWEDGKQPLSKKFWFKSTVDQILHMILSRVSREVECSSKSIVAFYVEFEFEFDAS